MAIRMFTFLKDEFTYTPQTSSQLRARPTFSQIVGWLLSWNNYIGDKVISSTQSEVARLFDYNWRVYLKKLAKPFGLPRFWEGTKKKTQHPRPHFSCASKAWIRGAINTKVIRAFKSSWPCFIGMGWDGMRPLYESFWDTTTNLKIACR